MSSCHEDPQHDTDPLLQRERINEKWAVPTVVWVLLLFYCSMFAYFHLLAPKLSLLELTICRVFYEGHDPRVIEIQSSWPGYSIDEPNCKIGEIQQRLSKFRSLGVFLDGLSSFLLSVPYGIIADKYGRRLPYTLSLLGLLLSNVCVVLVCTHFQVLSVDLVLVSSAFLSIGGGSYILIALAATMMSDLYRVHERSTALYWLLAAFYVAYITGTGLSPVTMRIPALPYYVALYALLSSLILTLAMPDTTSSSVLHTTIETSLVNDSSQTSFRPTVHALRRAITYSTYHSRLVVLIVLFPLIASRGVIPELILPYVSKRYGWALRDVGLLDALDGCLSLFQAMFVLPYSVRKLKERGWTIAHVNETVARYSASALSAGSLVIGFAPHVGVLVLGLIIFTTGFGIRMSVLALATSLVSPSQLARLSAVVVAVEAIADLIISPLIWRLWSVAIDLGGSGIGLPWFVIAAITSIVAAILWLFDFKPRIVEQTSVSTSHD